MTSLCPASYDICRASRGVGLFVADRSNNRIQILDQDLNLLDTGWEQYSRISGLWIDKGEIQLIGPIDEVADAYSEAIAEQPAPETDGALAG